MSGATSAGESRWHAALTADEGAARASALFARVFGGQPAAAASAPGRINVIGEHTDHMGGLALPTVMPHRTFVAAAARADGAVRVVSAFEGPDAVHQFALGEAGVEGWPAYVAGVLWALGERGYDGPGLDLAVHSCVPVGKGLGSSAALAAAVALAANSVWGLALETHDGLGELADACVTGEQKYVGVPTGALDPYAVLLTPPGEALLMDFAPRPPRVREQPLYFPEYGLGLLVVDTGTQRGNVDGRYAQRVAECMAACEALGAASLRAVADAPHALRRVEAISDPVLRSRARHVVTEIERTRLVASELSGTAPAHERFVTIGKAMYRSHASLAVDFEVSAPELDAAVDAAFATGALGARLVGGGFGGAAVALVRRAQAEQTAGHIADEMRAKGFGDPTFLLV